MKMSQLKTIVKRGESEILEFKKSTGQLSMAMRSWDSLTTNKCTINDLDKKRIRDFVRIAVTNGRLPGGAEEAGVSEILQKLELLENE